MSGLVFPERARTLEGFKRAAKKLKKYHPEITHTAALEQLARAWGFADYQAAHRHYANAERAA